MNKKNGMICVLKHIHILKECYFVAAISLVFCSLLFLWLCSHWCAICAKCKVKRLFDDELNCKSKIAATTLSCGSNIKKRGEKKKHTGKREPNEIENLCSTSFLPTVFFRFFFFYQWKRKIFYWIFKIYIWKKWRLNERARERYMKKAKMEREKKRGSERKIAEHSI